MVRMLDALIAGASRSEFVERIHAIAMTQGVPRHALCVMGRVISQRWARSAVHRPYDLNRWLSDYTEVNIKSVNFGSASFLRPVLSSCQVQ